MNASEKKLSRKISTAYASLGFSGTLLSQIAAFYLIYFYTDVLLIPVAAVTVLYLVSHIWDAINDQILGFLMCNTQSKYGNARPYLLWTSLPLGLLTTAMFFTPDFSVLGKIIYAYFIYFAWDIAVTYFTLATNSILPLVSRSLKERTAINSCRIIASVAAALLVSSYTLPLVNFFGGGDIKMTTQGDAQLGFLITAALYSLIAVPMILFSFCYIQERYSIQKRAKISLKIALQCFCDKGFMLLFFAFLIIWTASTFKISSTTYYVIHVMERPDCVSIVFFCGVGASFIMQCFISFISIRISIKYSVLIGLVGSVAGLLVMLAAQAALPGILLGNIIFGLFSAIPANLCFVILADYVDVCNEKYEQNVSPWIYATFNFGTKIGVSLGGTLLSAILTYVKYSPDATITPLVKSGMSFNFLIAPLIGTVAAFLFMLLFYRTRRSLSSPVIDK